MIIDMSDMLWIVYAAGVVTALLLTDAPPATRIGLALLWPLGPAAFLATVALLVGASAVAFPVFGAVMAGAALAWAIYWML